MGQKVGDRVTKSNWPEAIAGILIPPACREEVLGDLCERNATPQQYVRDALGTVPLVIASRIRRTCEPGLVAMYAAVLYLSFFAAAWFEVPGLLYERWASGASRFLARSGFWLSCSKTPTLRSVVCCEAPMFAIAVVFISQAALRALPFSIVLPGGLLGLVLNTRDPIAVSATIPVPTRSDMNSKIKISIALAAALLCAAIAWTIARQHRGQSTINYSQFVQQVEAGRVAEVKISGANSRR